MEEEGKKIKREKRLSEFRMTICEADKADADVEVIRAKRVFNAEQENLDRLEAELKNRE